MNFNMTEKGFAADLEFGNLQVSGDEQYGFRPYQLMVASVAVCSGGVLRKILEKKRLHIEDIQIEAKAERNEAEANRIERIHVHFAIKGKDLKEEAIAKAMELTRKNCSMVRSVEGSIDIQETFEIIG
ncbi:OsmC family peroxiredoxin [Bacillus sp. FJAT-42376]|uniref:OsmC family protein n=1 Tax=Bacillus sp. FJAT-42376 TaxID=2014076 RepID=UPI000F4D7AD4|nr:OsmC family protein [Bacillus sp. FJAT-42376]AZB41675.1 OsmC family peroxiredoxin [Bacillus sp. FJAT-42376]